MAKLTQDREEELMKRAASLRDEMNKVIARQEFMAKESTAVDRLQAQIMADRAAEASFTKMFDDAIKTVKHDAGLIRAPIIQPKSEAQWLEETQSMRVVALNEACGIAKAMIDDSVTVRPEEITRMAYNFAKFLTDGKA